MRVVTRPTQRESTIESGTARPLRRAGARHISFFVFFDARDRFGPREADRHRL